MFYGSILFKFIGTCVRWMLRGGKKSFKELWKGPDAKIADAAGYDLITNVIGGIALFIIIMIIMKIGR